MKNKRIIALLTILAGIFQHTASAALIDSVTAADGKITISGTVEDAYTDQLVTMTLLKNDKNISDINHIEKPIDAVSNIAILPLDENGAYTYTMPFTNADDKVFVKSGGEEQVVSIEEYKTDGQTLYVSPDGNDSASGTETDPLRTLAGARDRVYQLTQKDADTAITVYFLPGIYRFNDTVFIHFWNTGSANAPITYRAKIPGTVSFRGSVELNVSDLKKVTDKNIISRLPVGAQDKVYSIDLADYGITDDQVQFRNLDGISIDNRVSAAVPLGLYLNGKRQNIARWPNVGYDTFEDSDGNSLIVNNGSDDTNASNGAVFKFDEVNPMRWENADYMFIDGYLTTSYAGSWRKVKSIDTKNKTISLANGRIDEPFRRWTAVNLLEEIDMPSEFYIDRSTPKLTLYYYPAHELGENDVLEFANMYNDLVRLEKVSYITFKDIEFTQVYSRAISGDVNHHITIDGCSISHTGRDGINMWGVHDVVVKNSTVHNTSGEGISLRAGNVDEAEQRRQNAMLIPCGNKIINNHIYCMGFDVRSMGCGAYAEGTGARVENNVIHLSNNRGGNAFGADSVTAYNEEYNLIRDTADAGGFYVGKTWTKYGSKFEYNYVHDFGIETYKDRENTSAVFLDDTISGQCVENNIIINDYISGFKNPSGTVFGTYGVNINGGRDMAVKNNVFVGMDYAVRNTDRTNSDTYFDNEDNQKLLIDLKDFVVGYPYSPLVMKYPKMKEMYYEIIGTGSGAGSETVTTQKDQWGNDIQKRTIKTYGKFNPKNMDIDGNVVVGLQQNDADGVYFEGRITGEFADTNVINNRVSNDFGIFENSEKHDYRVKTSVADSMGLNASNGFMLTSGFDLNKIGMQDRDLELGDSFGKLFPVNGSKTENSRKVGITWEQALFADEYEYVIARNPELTDIVKKGTTIYKYAEIDGLEPNTRYYWNVTAKNNSKQAANDVNTWESDGGVYSFVTSVYDINAADIKAVELDGGVRFTAILSNSSGKTQNAELIIARFSSDGSLKNIAKSVQSIEAGINSKSFNIADISDSGDYYCFYVWDGIAGMRPLIGNKVYVRQ